MCLLCLLLLCTLPPFRAAQFYRKLEFAESVAELTARFPRRVVEVRQICVCQLSHELVELVLESKDMTSFTKSSPKS